MACHIIMDAMGGDHAPGAIVQGAVQALSAFEGTVTMYGMEDAIRKAMDDCDAPQDIRARIQIRAAEQVITMEDDPVDVVRKKKQSSMTLALKALANGEGDAFVGAGNTGAMVYGGIHDCTAAVRHQTGGTGDNFAHGTSAFDVGLRGQRDGYATAPGAICADGDCLYARAV